MKSDIKTAAAVAAGSIFSLVGVWAGNKLGTPANENGRDIASERVTIQSDLKTRIELDFNQQKQASLQAPPQKKSKAEVEAAIEATERCAEIRHELTVARRPLSEASPECK